MSMVLKYLKESTLPIVLVFLLLMLKVFADLTLPLYTSNIVNIGIQQGGLETAVPAVITAQTYAAVEAHMDSDNAAILSESYRYDGDTYLLPAYVLVDDAPLQEATILPILARLGMGETGRPAPESILKQAALAYIRTDLEVLGVDVPAIQNSYIVQVGLRMLAISALGVAASILVSYFASRVAARLGRRLRGDVFKKVVSFSQDEMDRFSTASLVTRSTNDIQQIQQSFVMILRVVIFAPMMALGGLFRVLRTNSSMSWTIGVAILAIFTIVITMFALAMPRFKRLQILVDNVNQVVRETLNGLQVIRAFNTQEHERLRFEKANTELTATSLFVNRAMSGMMPLMMLIMNLTAILIIFNGGKHIQAGTMQVGDMMAFIQYAMLIIMSFLMITMLTIMLPRASISATRIKEVLQTPITIDTATSTLPFPPEPQGRVEFNHVGFTYPGANTEAISDISFVAERGTTTAIIGSTGSGKSTLLNLIPRFHDVTSGSITIDGIDIRQRDLKALRKLVGYVPQQGLLFSGTIASNIAYGEPGLTSEAIEAAAEIAQAGTFIGEKPDTYQSPIAQGGVNVSGGQRQRLSIARAIAASPKILLFDDSFSALDYRTENNLRKRLRTDLPATTVLVVAQRISSIIHADTILVIDEGRLVGKGTHAHLMQSCPVYQQIAHSQLSLQEIKNHG